jgi:hypothetical protein
MDHVELEAKNITNLALVDRVSWQLQHDFATSIPNVNNHFQANEQQEKRSLLDGLMCRAVKQRKRSDGRCSFTKRINI